MKWLSVKKYKPANGDQYVLIRHSSGPIFSITIGSLEDGHEKWLELSSEEELKNVTHFCHIPPINIEDD